MEGALGADFSAVRIHEGPEAESQGALAYTQGTEIHFAPGQYQPDSDEGQELIGHELAHVIQQAQGRVQATRQGKGVAINDDRGLESEADEMGARAARGGAPAGAAVTETTSATTTCATCGTEAGAAAGGGCPACGAAKGGGPAQTKLSHGTGQVTQLQATPGTGMSPPGDCGWAKYLALLGAVESAKAIVSMLGACSVGDSCPTLALKIAAISTEIAARVARDATCFRGGDAGHRQQVQDKINMLNRCYRFFSQSNCPQALVEAMEAVVARAREVVTAAAVAVVAVALIVALVAAIVVLVEAIIAAGAGAAAAGVMAVLALIIGLLSPSQEGSGQAA